MLWASTQFYADFAEVAAMTLGKAGLGTADYEAARQTVVDVILTGCLPPEPDLRISGTFAGV
jgi:hypothetical protein